jgi:hypothetical protein
MKTASHETGEIPNVTLMQLRAVQAAVRGEVAPGATACAQYHRLRRLAIKLGNHRPRADAHRQTRTYAYCDDRTAGRVQSSLN